MYQRFRQQLEPPFGRRWKTLNGGSPVPGDDETVRIVGSLEFSQFSLDRRKLSFEVMESVGVSRHVHTLTHPLTPFGSHTDVVLEWG